MPSAVPAPARRVVVPYGGAAFDRLWGGDMSPPYRVIIRGIEMSFGNLYFVFGFLPASLLFYFIAPHRMKNTVLLLCSLVFFAWGEPTYLLLLALSVAFNYFTGRELDLLLRAEKKGVARFVLSCSVVLNLLLLCFFKYGAELLGGRALPMPIGISFFTFSLLSFLFDIYRGRAPAAKNIIDFGLFVTFFPKLVSGPIVRYAEMEAQLRDHPFTWEKFGGGARLFLIGLSKKVLLANTLGATFYALSALPAASLSAAGAWLCAIAYSLMLYFDFGGYSDMAIGLAGLFGFEFQKNFDYPYLSGTVADFWRRWHISLGAWFREYVYIPLGGSRRGNFRTALNLMVVWLLTGVWHGTGACFLLWGVYYGVLLVLEKLILRRLLERFPKVLRHMLTLLCVVIGWVFFFSPSPQAAFTLLGRMFGTGKLLDAAAKYEWTAAWRIVLLAVLACLPIGAHIGRCLTQRGRAWIPLSLVYYAALLLLCIAGMMNDTYSAFLYFQF